MQFETGYQATDDQPTVFVIEREQVVRSALHYILRDRYRTCAFASLDDALASTLDAPDVVLVGVSTLQGQHDGLPAVLCKRYGGAPVLVVADRLSDPLAQRALEGGAREIVCKPISFDTVCDAVDRALAAPIPNDAPSHLIRVSFG
jgi:DNA-binding NarL/FixJ family response regulator